SNGVILDPLIENILNQLLGSIKVLARNLFSARISHAANEKSIRAAPGILSSNVIRRISTYCAPQVTSRVKYYLSQSPIPLPNTTLIPSPLATANVNTSGIVLLHRPPWA